METSSKTYQELKYKTTMSLTELEEKIERVRNFTRSVKVKLHAGKLTWNELGDVNRVKVSLGEFYFLDSYKNNLEKK